jgi:hypothetical protein
LFINSVRTPISAHTYFVSQNWEATRYDAATQDYIPSGTKPHPDNAENSKLRWMKVGGM